jgi:scyllo-inositol 2-dehydrogenase (NADP+)
VTARVVLVGHGLAGKTFHEPFLRSTPGLDLVGIVRSADVGTMWDLRPDLVVLATPNATHVPLGLEAVRRGVAVVVDKPLGLSVADAQPLVALAAAEGVPLGVFHNRRWDGDFMTAQQLLSSGALGSLVLWESRFERWRPSVGTGWRETSDGGGLLLDLGSHLVDQALVAVGPAVSVHATVRVVRPGAAQDDDVQITLEHISGARSLLVATMLAAQVGPRFRLLGTSAAWVKHGLDGQEVVLRGGAAPVEDGGRLGSDEAFEQLPPRPGDWGAYYALVSDALATGGPMPVTGEEGLEVLRVLDAARESAASRSVVHLV